MRILDVYSVVQWRGILAVPFFTCKGISVNGYFDIRIGAHPVTSVATVEHHMRHDSNFVCLHRRTQMTRQQ